MKTFVVDASTCLKWTFNDEVDSEIAITLQKHYLAGDINLIAPNLWLYEIINGLVSAKLKKKTLFLSDLDSKLVDLINSSPNLMDISDLSSLCLKNSVRYKISAYDSAYITLAHAHGLTFITADRKLAGKVGDLELAISLKEFKIN